MKWEMKEGRELEHQYLSEGLDLTSKPAIYVWRRSFDTTALHLSTSEDVEKWVEGLAHEPVGIIGQKTLMHSIAIKEIRVGGQGWTKEKREVLNEVCLDSGLRSHLVDFATSLGRLALALYVGKATNLRVRIREHFDGDSSLVEYNQALGLDWDNVALWYYQLPLESSEITKEEEKLLELLEFTAQRALAPLGTKRVG